MTTIRSDKNIVIQHIFVNLKFKNDRGSFHASKNRIIQVRMFISTCFSFTYLYTLESIIHFFYTFLKSTFCLLSFSLIVSIIQ